MNVFNLRTPLPAGPELVFVGDTFNNAHLDCIAFHGGIVAVRHNIQAAPDKSPLTRKEEIVLGMSSIGMSRNGIANALFNSPNTTASQLRTAYQKLDIPLGGHSTRHAATGRAFEVGIFDIQVGITNEEEMPDPAYLRHVAEGGAVDTFMPAGRTVTTPDMRTEGNLTRLRLGLPNAKAYLFYSHLAGWLPLQQEIKTTR